MARPYDICILGSGIVGRTLALHLAGLPLRIALVETSPTAPPNADAEPAARDVRAFALNHSARKLLQSLRAWPESAAATAVQNMQIWGDDGGHVHFSAAQQGSEALNWIVDVPALEDLLANAVRFQPRIECLPEAVPATLTVVCEGKSSHTREALGVELDSAPYAQSALATRVHCTLPHGQTARQWFAGDAILALLPLDGPEGHGCALVWSLPPEKAQALQAVPAEDFQAALFAASHGVLGELTLQGARKVWPLQHAMAQRWCGSNAQGAWVLAGDAAHTVHPLAGQGLNLGLGDVAALVEAIAKKDYWRSVGDLRVLRPYERARKTECTLVGRTGDALQQLFAKQNTSLQTLRNWGMQGFEREPRLKAWVAQRAMGSQASPSVH